MEQTKFIKSLAFITIVALVILLLSTSIQAYKGTDIGVDMENGVIEIWNDENIYYINESGFQVSNIPGVHWADMVWCEKVKIAGVWKETKCADGMNFNWTITTDNATYAKALGVISLNNAKVWLQAYIEPDDKDLNITFRIKNDGAQDWDKLILSYEHRDIEIGEDWENDYACAWKNGKKCYNLSNVSEVNSTNLDARYVRIFDNVTQKDIRIRWNDYYTKNGTELPLNYRLSLINTSSDDNKNAYVQLIMDFGAVPVNSWIQASVFWVDAQVQMLPLEEIANAGTILGGPPSPIAVMWVDDEPGPDNIRNISIGAGPNIDYEVLLADQTAPSLIASIDQINITDNLWLNVTLESGGISSLYIYNYTADAYQDMSQTYNTTTTSNTINLNLCNTNASCNDFVNTSGTANITMRVQHIATQGALEVFALNIDYLVGTLVNTLAAVPQTNESVNMIDLNVTNCTFASTSFVNCTAVVFNTAVIENYTLMTSLNIEKATGGSTSIVTGRVLINDTTNLATEELRTISGLNDEGSTGFSPVILELPAGEHTLTLQFNRTGNGAVSVHEIDLILVELAGATSGSAVYANITNMSFEHSSTTFDFPFNFSVNKSSNSSTFILSKMFVNSSQSAGVQYSILDANGSLESPHIERTLSSSSDKGSVSMSFISDNELNPHQHSLKARTSAGTVTVSGSILNMDMADVGNNTIQNFETGNTTTNFTANATFSAGSHTIASSTVTIQNGTSLLLTAYASFMSSSGAQTPSININTTNVSEATCYSKKDRSLSGNTDIGNAFIRTACDGLTPGDSYTINLNLLVPTGETVILLDESLSGFEANNLSITVLSLEVDADGDGFNNSVDCDDLNTSIRPLAGANTSNVTITATTTFCPGDWTNVMLNVGAQNITLDGNGSLTMNGLANQPVGINISAFSGVNITDFTVINMSKAAIEMSNADNNRITSPFTLNATGTESIKIHTDSDNNWFSGLTLNRGVCTTLSAGNTFFNNTITTNNIGIYVNNSNDTNISSNSITTDTATSTIDCIRFWGEDFPSNNNTANRNTFQCTRSFVDQFTDSLVSEIHDNVGNSTRGLSFVFDSKNGNISGNVMNTSGEACYYFQANSNTHTFTDEQCISKKEYGIQSGGGNSNADDINFFRSNITSHKSYINMFDGQDWFIVNSTLIRTNTSFMEINVTRSSDANVNLTILNSTVTNLSSITVTNANANARIQYYVTDVRVKNGSGACPSCVTNVSDNASVQYFNGTTNASGFIANSLTVTSVFANSTDRAVYKIIANATDGNLRGTNETSLFSTSRLLWVSLAATPGGGSGGSGTGGPVTGGGGATLNLNITIDTDFDNTTEQYLLELRTANETDISKNVTVTYWVENTTGEIVIEKKIRIITVKELENLIWRSFFDLSRLNPGNYFQVVEITTGDGEFYRLHDTEGEPLPNPHRELVTVGELGFFAKLFLLLKQPFGLILLLLLLLLIVLYLTSKNEKRRPNG